MQSNRPTFNQNPIVWMIAGGAIALVLVAGLAIVLVPSLLPQETPLAIAESTVTMASLAGSTEIPTFTPSPTLSPTPTSTPSLTPTPSHTPTTTPTETPTLTPTITPTPLPVVVAEKDTRLYLGPGTNYPEQGWLPKGEVAPIISQLVGGGWWYVESLYGVKGWAQADTVRTENDISGVPQVTPLPYQSRPVVQPTTGVQPEITGPLELIEVWPVAVDCSGFYELDLWIKAAGGTGVYTYLVNGEIVAEGIENDGITTRISSATGSWVGKISVISGDLQVETEMGFSRSKWCD